MPPRQVELPELAMDAAVELPVTAVLPKKVCRCERPGWPGSTMGSSNAMWLKSQTVRKLPVPSLPLGCSVVLLRRSVE